MSVYSTRLYGPALVTAAASSILTVPAGLTYVVQTLIAVVQTPSPGALLVLYVGGSGAANRVFRRPITADTTIIEVNLRLVLESGDVLWAGGSTAVTLSLHGYELSEQ